MSFYVDYMKGDSAFLYVMPSNQRLTTDINSPANKELVRVFITKALSQKGDPTENLRILRISAGTPGLGNEPYLQVDFE
jgi:hypothetical protein